MHFNCYITRLPSIALLVAVLLLALAGCDQAGFDSQEEASSSTRTTADVNSIASQSLPSRGVMLKKLSDQLGWATDGTLQNGATSPYGCYLAEHGGKTSQGWTYRSVRLNFSFKASASSNVEKPQTVTYRGRASNGKLRSLTTCIIPAGPQAREKLPQMLLDRTDALGISVVGLGSCKTASSNKPANSSDRTDGPGRATTNSCEMVLDYAVCFRNAQGELYNCSYHYRYVCSGGGGGSGSGGGGGGGIGGGGGGDCPNVTFTGECAPDGGGGVIIPGAAPEGVDQSVYEAMNAAERALCWANPFQCASVWSMSNVAMDWASDTGLPGAHNGPQDAVRHAAWSGLITAKHGEADATAWTDAHEWDSTSPSETAMDQYNNAVGREIGSTVSFFNIQEVLDKVMEAYEDGDLCTSLEENC